MSLFVVWIEAADEFLISPTKTILSSIHTRMLSSLVKLVFRPRFSLSLIQQQHLFASASKGDSTSPSTGDTHEKGTKDIHDPKIDASHQPGPTTQEDRDAWMKKEHEGLSPNGNARSSRESQKKSKGSKN